MKRRGRPSGRRRPNLSDSDFTEIERLPTDKFVTSDHRTPVSFDVLDYDPGTVFMCTGQPMKRVREVAAQDRTLAEVHKLPYSERTAQDADIGVDTHDKDVVDPPGGEKVEHLLTIIADGVQA
jgi:hypothetical protein